jgi:hypothetical protein
MKVCVAQAPPVRTQRHTGGRKASENSAKN